MGKGIVSEPHPGLNYNGGGCWKNQSWQGDYEDLKEELVALALINGLHCGDLISHLSLGILAANEQENGKHEYNCIDEP